MRSLWKGAVSFGLVHIPIKLYTATKRDDIAFNQLHDVCGSRIRYKRFCPHCEIEVTNDDILRGYEYAKDSYVVVSDEEMEQLPVPGTKKIEIAQFVRLEEIDPVFFDTTYYLEPAEGGEKAYALLREALLRTGRIAIATVVLRKKGSLCALRASGGEGGALMMETMFYPSEIRSSAALQGVSNYPPLRDDELALAVQLIENLSHPFAPERYTDEYREALLSLIHDKIRGQQVARAPVAPPSRKVADLMEALRASLEATGATVAPATSPGNGNMKGRNGNGVQQIPMSSVPAPNPWAQPKTDGQPFNTKP